MTVTRTQATDAQATLRQLLMDQGRRKTPRNAIRVSFRKEGGAVGRRDSATHWVHWYPAKMFHRIPSVFLDTMSFPRNSLILDPFCGSGTVLLEANLRGHHAVGIDINPLAQLISRVKTTPLHPAELLNQLSLLCSSAELSESEPDQDPTLDSWLSSQARIGLHRLALGIFEIAKSDVRDFFLVALSSIVRRASNADPAIPPLVRLRAEKAESAGLRYSRALSRSQSVTITSVYSSFKRAARANIARMSELHSLRHGLGRTTLGTLGADAANTYLPAESVDCIITSPPYCGSQKYVRSLKLEMLLTGCPPEKLRELDRQTLGTEAIPTRHTPLADLLTGDRFVDNIIQAIYAANPVRARMASDYARYITRFVNECCRVLRPGGHTLATLGRSTLAGVEFPIDEIFRRTGRQNGLKVIATLIDPIPSRGLLMKRHRTTQRIDEEHIVWMQRAA